MRSMKARIEAWSWTRWETWWGRPWRHDDHRHPEAVAVVEPRPEARGQPGLDRVRLDRGAGGGRGRAAPALVAGDEQRGALPGRRLLQRQVRRATGSPPPPGCPVGSPRKWCRSPAPSSPAAATPPLRPRRSGRWLSLARCGAMEDLRHDQRALGAARRVSSPDPVVVEAVEDRPDGRRNLPRSAEVVESRPAGRGREQGRGWGRSGPGRTGSSDVARQRVGDREVAGPRTTSPTGRWPGRSRRCGAVRGGVAAVPFSWPGGRRPAGRPSGVGRADGGVPEASGSCRPAPRAPAQPVDAAALVQRQRPEDVVEGVVLEQDHALDPQASRPAGRPGCLGPQERRGAGTASPRREPTRRRGASAIRRPHGAPCGGSSRCSFAGGDHTSPARTNMSVRLIPTAASRSADLAGRGRDAWHHPTACAPRRRVCVDPRRRAAVAPRSWGSRALCHRGLGGLASDHDVVQEGNDDLASSYRRAPSRVRLSPPRRCGSKRSGRPQAPSRTATGSRRSTSPATGGLLHDRRDPRRASGSAFGAEPSGTVTIVTDLIRRPTGAA